MSNENELDGSLTFNEVLDKMVEHLNNTFVLVVNDDDYEIPLLFWSESHGTWTSDEKLATKYTLEEKESCINQNLIPGGDENSEWLSLKELNAEYPDDSDGCFTAREIGREVMMRR
jgi:hypothetical protein